MAPPSYHWLTLTTLDITGFCLFYWLLRMPFPIIDTLYYLFILAPSHTRASIYPLKENERFPEILNQNHRQRSRKNVPSRPRIHHTNMRQTANPNLNPSLTPRLEPKQEQKPTSKQETAPKPEPALKPQQKVLFLRTRRQGQILMRIRVDVPR